MFAVLVCVSPSKYELNSTFAFCVLEFCDDRSFSDSACVTP